MTGNRFFMYLSAIDSPRFMGRTLPLFLSLLCSSLAFGQAARLVFNNAAATMGSHPWVVFSPTSPGAYVVIDNPATTGIQQLVTTANVPVIKSEHETNKLRWATGATVGTFDVPFSTTSGVAMPLSVNKTTAGAGAGSIIFSTYNSLAIGTPVASGWNNDLYRPSDVTHMHDEPTGGANNSDNAIDRFWIIDAGEAGYAYTTKPAVTLAIGFDPAESAINGGNSPALAAANGNLVAQRFNSPLQKWYDIAVLGAQTGNAVGAVSPAPADFFRSWTLSNKLLPLPIQLAAWGGECQGRTVMLKWATASEQDNQWFTIERSRDAQDWAAVGTVPGAGNSSTMLEYSFVDADALPLAYYRLRQTDLNGTSTVSATIAVGCGTGGGTTIVNAWDEGDHLSLAVSSTQDGVYDLTLMDAQGKVMAVQAAQAIGTGITTLHVPKRGIATGIYLVQLQNSTNRMSRRVHLW